MPRPAGEDAQIEAQLRTVADQPAQDRQRDQMVAARGHRHQAFGADLGVEGGDAGEAVLQVGRVHRAVAEVGAAGAGALAAGTVAVPGVAGVFLGSDFVTVTKAEGVAWEHIKPAILGAIMEHYQSGIPVMEGEAPKANSGHREHTGEDGDIVEQIKELLDTRVRPAVAQDGGDITFKGFRDGTVFLNMKGACAGCPSSTATLKNGIEQLLRYYVPEVTEVRAV